MAVEMTQDERTVEINNEGQYVLTAHQQQVYDKENVDAMLADWGKKEAEIVAWLEKFDQHIEDGKKLLIQQLEKQKETLEAELASIREGRKIWQNASGREDQGSAEVPGEAPNKG